VLSAVAAEASCVAEPAIIDLPQDFWLTIDEHTGLHVGGGLMNQVLPVYRKKAPRCSKSLIGCQLNFLPHTYKYIF
jgi:hypothetical protein